MNLRDAKTLDKVSQTIDAVIAAFGPAGVNVNALMRLYPDLTCASYAVKDMYARIIQDFPIIAVEIKEEPETVKATITVKEDAETETEDDTGG